MDETKKGGKVLVVGSLPDFHQLVGKSLENRFDVIYASNENEGLSKARTERPQVLILGYLDPRGSSFRLHKKLREGWITKHIPQLVVDVHFSEVPDRAWTPQEAMQMDARRPIPSEKRSLVPNSSVSPGSRSRAEAPSSCNKNS
jgi:DNA-binding NarL/FixJ family response regulator